MSLKSDHSQVYAGPCICEAYRAHKLSSILRVLVSQELRSGAAEPLTLVAAPRPTENKHLYQHRLYTFVARCVSLAADPCYT